jgi:membrane protease YdiL (CAAX protease family)
METLAGAFVLLLFSSSLMLWWRAVRRHLAAEPVLDAEPKSAVPWSLLDLFLGVFCYLAANVAAITVVQVILRLPADTDLDRLRPEQQKIVLLAVAIASLVTCVLIVLLLVARYRVSPRQLGWFAPSLFRDLTVGVAAFVMLAPMVYGIQWGLTRIVESEHPLLELVKANPDLAFISIAFVMAVVIAPITEEFLFRVLLQGWLERVAGLTPMAEGARAAPEFQTNAQSTEETSVGSEALLIPAAAPAGDVENPYFAQLAEVPVQSSQDLEIVQRPTRWGPIVISSLLFALTHWSHGPDPIPLFVFALGLGYLFQKTHRIVPCIVMHAALNLCSMLGFILSVYSKES